MMETGILWRERNPAFSIFVLICFSSVLAYSAYDFSQRLLAGRLEMLYALAVVFAGIVALLVLAFFVKSILKPDKELLVKEEGMQLPALEAQAGQLAFRSAPWNEIKEIEVSLATDDIRMTEVIVLTSDGERFGCRLPQEAAASFKNAIGKAGQGLKLRLKDE